MNTNDQWFNPGDKVARVAHQPHPYAFSGLHIVPFGEVFCVESCFQAWQGYNVITLVGKPTLPGQGFVARNFRRVDEIKLCVAAAKHIKQREEELV